MYRRFQGVLFSVWGVGSLEEYFTGEKKFNEKGEGFSSITRKNKHEKVFSIGSKE